MRTDHGSGVPDSATFAQTLSELKRTGSNLLLVGETDGAAHRTACGRLMGFDGDDPRQRVYVHTRGAEGVSALPDSAPEDATVVVRHQSVDHDRPLPPTVEEVVVDSDLLSAMGTTALQAVDDIEDTVDRGSTSPRSQAHEDTVDRGSSNSAEDDATLDPGELRLCLDSVRPLLQQHRSETVFRLLHMVTSRVRQSDGMGHFHLPLSNDNDYVRLLEPLFDAIVEVRHEDDTVEQRWHLRDSEVTSDWLEL